MGNKSNIYVGVTDNDWYDYLANTKPDELNFWQPGGKQVFRALQPYDLFLFKLHSPLNYIAGGGFLFAMLFCRFPWLGKLLAIRTERLIT